MNDASIDELLEAIETTRVLKLTLALHEELFAAVGDMLDRIERRLTLIEAREP